MRTAIVTGAARGLGRAISERLVRDGYEVWAVDTDADELAATAAAVGANPVDARRDRSGRRRPPGRRARAPRRARQQRGHLVLHAAGQHAHRPGAAGAVGEHRRPAAAHAAAAAALDRGRGRLDRQPLLDHGQVLAHRRRAVPGVEGRARGPDPRRRRRVRTAGRALQRRRAGHHPHRGHAVALRRRRHPPAPRASVAGRPLRTARRHRRRRRLPGRRRVALRHRPGAVRRRRLHRGRGGLLPPGPRRGPP